MITTLAAPTAPLLTSAEIARASSASPGATRDQLLAAVERSLRTEVDNAAKGLDTDTLRAQAEYFVALAEYCDDVAGYDARERFRAHLWAQKAAA